MPPRRTPHPHPHPHPHPQPHPHSHPHANPNQKECKTCKLGSYCPEGASVPTPCPADYYGDGGEDVHGNRKGEGVYGIRKGLADESQCKPCDKGMRCPAGSFCSHPNYDPSKYPDGTISAPGDYTCIEVTPTPTPNPTPTPTPNPIPNPNPDPSQVGAALLSDACEAAILPKVG